MIRKIQKRIYRMLKKFRYKAVRRVLSKNSTTLLDIGCQDLKMYNMIKNRYEVTLADLEPKNPRVKQEDVQKLSFKDNSFDTVVCQEVLEHVPNPVQAMGELKRVAKKQLVITVPYEPFFTLFRFLNWEPEHLWAVTPKVLEMHLGKPRISKKLVFKRYYLGVWDVQKKK